MAWRSKGGLLGWKELKRLDKEIELERIGMLRGKGWKMKKK